MPRVSIGQAALMITVATLLARVLGLLRGSLFTEVLGATTTSDAFNRAFLIPNSIYTIVTGGALISAFIPVFNQYMLEKRDKQEAWRVASLAINLATLAMVALGLLAIVFARQLVAVYNPGVSAAQLDLVAVLTRIMLLQAVIMGVGIVISAILNARQHFFLPALGSVLYSAGLIIGLIPGLVLIRLNQPNALIAVYCATGGVVLGAVLMVGVQFFGLPRVGMHYTFSLQWRHRGIVLMVRLMVPRVINAVALNLSLTMDVFLVSLLAFAGFVTLYTLAFTILMIPLGMVINVATAMFPAMTEYAASGRMDRFRTVVLDALRSTLFIAIPAAIGLILLSLPIVQVLYEHGSLFTLNDAIMTSIPLMGYAVGLPGWAASEILTRSFYALRDSKTPVIVSIWQFALKIALSLTLMDPVVWLAQMHLGVFAHPSSVSIAMASAWGMGALAFATSLAVLSEAGMLLWLLHKRIGGLHLRLLVPFISRIMAAVIVMILAIAITHWLLDLLIVTGDASGNQSLTVGEIARVLLKLVITVAIGGIVYLRMARYAGLLSSKELAPIQRLLVRLHLSWL
jgi:putative peptidoglycan lipid II flippase